MQLRRSSGLVIAFVVAIVVGFGLPGCQDPPEHCVRCLANLADAGFQFDVAEGSRDTMGTGGVMGTEGVIGTSGAGTGRRGTGGEGTGGTGTGGVSSGGANTGGSGTGGDGTGGTGTGGVGSGGANTGGSGTGGEGTGGTGTGAAGTRGTGTGGAGTADQGTGGAGTGGQGTGGIGTGGVGTGGTGTGGVGSGGVGTGGAGTGGATAQGLVLRYPFDAATGTTAVDSSGFAGGPRNGTLTNAGAGTATFSAVAPLQIGTGYVSLTGTSNTNGGYVAIPTLATLRTLAPMDVTIAAWVYVTTNRNGQKIFDFGITPTGGGNPRAYMFLTTNQARVLSSSVRFTITAAGNVAEQSITSAVPLSTNAWHHVAVVLPAGATYTGTLFIDGAPAATTVGMTVHPAALTGTGTPFGYIGRSGFAQDPYFAGRIDDFRVYDRALGRAEIAALFALR